MGARPPFPRRLFPARLFPRTSIDRATPALCSFLVTLCHRMENMCSLALILLSLSGAYSDSHSLRYYSIGVSAPGSGLPQFSIVAYLDDQQVELYSGDIGRSVPVAPWLSRNVGPEHWERREIISKENEALFKHEVKAAVKRFNHTGGFHFVQVMHSCEMRDDGSTIGHQEYRYDGEEYMYLDMKTALFIPTMAEAQITTQRWNSPDIRRGEWVKNFLESRCIETLKKYLEFGREDLERRVQPGVKVQGQESTKVTKLHCHVYGFHPRAVYVKWMKNGVDDIPSYETTHVLPNPDGTYQIRVSVEVIPKEGESYSCYVDHSSLEEPLLVKWEPKQNIFRTIVICAAISAVIIVVIVITGILIYKNRNNYRAASTSDT
ncbi:major histocompatibility complex class I-related gene protein-like isoform X3 [Bufo gargarizans]|uniref:major histocompatibility complex class I-related gene protein-like isoform X3 n=1 Tax=Bufo gargarizans TaxID=30331 RepID=UPI001CF514E5|nr:major histocompatibility complex class I-related gene protein-like isoform X3 [Bufo gargarizans]